MMLIRKMLNIRYLLYTGIMSIKIKILRAYGIYNMKGGNPKGAFSDDVSDMGKLSVKLILSH